MEIFGHSSGTALVTGLLGALAAGFVFSGAWGLSGRDLWLPDSAVLDGALSHSEFATTLRGRRARIVGAVFLALGAAFAVAALRVWRADAF